MSQLLLSELTSLSSETRRKHPEVRAAADAALAALKADQAQALRQASTTATPAEENLLLKPILLACVGKTAPKVASIAVGLMQRVVGMKVVPETALPTLIETLTNLVQSRNDVDVHLKVLQVVSSLLSSYASIHGDLLADALHVCFRLQDSRVTVVSSTAAATLRQAVMTVFEKVKDEDAVLDALKTGGEDAAAAAPLAAMTVPIPGTDGVTLFPCSRDAFRTITDLNSLASGEQAPFLRLSSLPRTFSLELIESVLTNHSHLFRPNTHPELLLCLRQATCPLLIRGLSERPAFPTTLRLMRLLFVLLRQFSQELRVEVEILMSILLRLIAPPNSAAAAQQGDAEDQHHPTPLWQRVLAMEATRSLCSDGELLRNLWKWYDGSSSSASVFSGLVDALQRLAVEQPGAIGKADPADQLTSDDAIAAPRPSISGGRGLYEAAASAVGALAGSSSNADAATAGAGLSQTSVPGVQLLDQLDKADAPTPPTTYLYLLALQSLVHLSQSMASFVLPAYSTFVNSRPKTSPRAPPALNLDTYSGEQKVELVVLRDMIKASWTAISTSYTFFLSSKCDEALFSEVLVALRNFTNATGVLGLQGPRDALIAALSRFAVPRTVLNRLEEQRKSGTGATQDEAAHAVALSERNAACLKAVTQIAYYLSGSLSWREVLETLCDAEYVLRCTGSKRRRAAASEANEEPGGGAAYSPRASMASFSLLSANVAGFSSATSVDPRTGRPAAMGGLETETLLADIARVFENTQALDTKAFLGFLQALCALCADGTGAARVGTGAPATPNAKRASIVAARPRASMAERSFALSSLELVIMLNVARLTLLGPEQGWTVVTAQLVAILSDASVKPAFRSQAAGILDAFVFAAISAKAPAGVGSDAEANVASPERIQRQVLDALSQQAILQERRASVADVDVRRQALEALLRILEAHGHGLVLGWEIIFEMCSAACAQVPSPTEGEAVAPTAGPRSPVPLIKAAFASLQLVCSDLLSALSLKQLELCVASLTAFSKQGDDVNVALTANGTLWGITAELAARAAADTGAGANEELTALWTYLLRSLLRVSADQRSDVRNGAVSNLFRVLEQYGAGLDAVVWADVIMADVVFPLLAELEAASKAEREKAKGDAGLESRDRVANTMGTRASPQAQWDESRVLATTSFGQVVAQYLGDKLVAAGEDRFERIWTELLRRLQSAFLEGPSSISQASILALQAIVSVKVPEGQEQVYKAAWSKAWETWSAIGLAIPTAPATLTQANLLAFVNTLTPIYRLLVADMPLAQLEQLLLALKNCVAYASSPDEVPDVDNLTPVQAAVRAFITSMQIIPGLPTLLIADLAEYSTLALTAAAAPSPAPSSSGKKASSFTYVALNKAVVQDLLEHFERFEREREIFESGALESTFASLLVPVKLKYECPPSFRHAQADKQPRPLWQSATLVFCKLAKGTCRALEREGEKLADEHVAGLWRQMLLVFQAALDADCSYALKLEAADAERDEVFDLTLLSTLELDILPHLGGSRVPPELITSLAGALSRASKLYDANLDGGDGSHDLKDGTVAPITPRPREYFAYWAFDLLFLICSDRWQDNLASRQRVAGLALPALLERCSQAMQSYVADARLRGMSPSTRLRDEELCYILSSLIDLHLWPGSLADKAKPQVDESVASATSLRSLALQTPRAHLFALYPTFCSLLAYHPPSGAPTSKGTSPGSSRILTVPLELPQGFQLGRVGKPNPLESARLDREGSVHCAKLVEQALEIVGSFWA